MLNRLLLFTLLLFSVEYTVAQQDKAARRRNFNTEHFIALREFDPVSYFQNRPVKGKSEFSYDHEWIVYYFSSDANREEFKKSPAKYEPAYGGWCAYTVATTGERVKVDPTAYKIINGKLHLFYNFSGDNRLRRWDAAKDQKALKAAADKNWVKRMH
jgi:YHS domain-containing protein